MDEHRAKRENRRKSSGRWHVNFGEISMVSVTYS